MRASWQVRRAELHDLEWIVELAAESAGAPRWSEAVWRGVLGSRAVFVAESGEWLVGFVVAGCVGEIAELESVAVAEAERRQGIGLELCLQAVRWAKEQGAEAMDLEVRAASAGAQALYRSLGFVEQRRRAGYYSDPVEDAVVMELRLKG